MSACRDQRRIVDMALDTSAEMADKTLRIAGVDEAGRGPLAGPVVVAAVILDPGLPAIAGLDDSKALSARRREALAEVIKNQALGFAIAVISARDIDRLNILQATMEGMRQAVAALSPQAEQALIDGNRCPSGLPCPAEAVIGGDGIHPEISAASILAKSHRDALMIELDQRYPEYGFAGHKGYPTAAHLEALRRHGPCPEHRQSFRPVQQLSLFPSPP